MSKPKRKLHKKGEQNFIKGTLSNGFEFEINEKALDDIELVDALSEVEDNPLEISKITKKLLGTEQRKKLYNHIRLKDGRVPTIKTAEAIREIFEIMGKDGKNFSSSLM